MRQQVASGLAAAERAAEVGVTGDQIVGYRVQYRLRGLGPTGPVQPDSPIGQRWKERTGGGNRYEGCAQDSFPCLV
jgi:hypothetical protein